MNESLSEHTLVIKSLKLLLGDGLVHLHILKGAH
jgi:hypothetical protein